MIQPELTSFHFYSIRERLSDFSLNFRKKQNNNFSAVRRNEIRILISATKMKLNIQGLLVPFPYDYIYPGITVLNTFLSKPRR